MKIEIDQVFAQPVGELSVEIVERKGLGHPDTICDSVMEATSQSLYRAYAKQFGTILHYNCDKALLAAGRAEHRLGGGKILQPMTLFMGDRASNQWRGRSLDVASIAEETAREWFRDNLHFVDPDRHLRCSVELRQGSEELTGIFAQAAAVVGANDTSAVVGYAPLSETETLVLEAENFLNGPSFKRFCPGTGQDVKVMGVRRGRRLEMTVAMPWIDCFVESEKAYFEGKDHAAMLLKNHLESRLSKVESVELSINALDRPGCGTSGLYLSVIGTSAEDADSGQVGRGNSVNGLISLQRPAGAEAAAGKNPVSHVGKIYGVLAHQAAGRLHREVKGLEEVFVWLCSRIGDPVDQPRTVYLQLRPAPGVDFEEIATAARQTMACQLQEVAQLCKDLAEGRWKVF